MKEKHSEISDEKHYPETAKETPTIANQENHQSGIANFDRESTLEKRKDSSMSMNLENIAPKKRYLVISQHRKLKGLKGTVSNTPVKLSLRKTKYDGW
jgi:hypothetical protein